MLRRLQRSSNPFAGMSVTGAGALDGLKRSDGRASRTVATDEEKKAAGETRKGKVYWTDVTFRPPPTTLQATRPPAN